MQLVLLFLAIIPIIVILTYIYRKDKNKEPGKLLVLLFLMGIVSCFMVLGVSELIYLIFPFMSEGSEYMNFFEVMAYAFIGVALVEEFCKFFMSYLFSYKNKAYDEVYDGIVYTVFVSLGFAFFENLLYVFTNQSVTVGIARGILAVPGHACDAVFMGYYLSVAKVYSQRKQKSLERKNLFLSVLAPTILHGIYDFCLFTEQNVFIILFLIFVVFLYIGAIKKIKQLSGQNNQQKQSTVVNNYQSNSVPIPPRPEPKNNGGFVQMAPELPTHSSQNNLMSPPNSSPVQNTNFQQNGYVNMNSNQTDKFCATCGSPVTGQFCGKCGSKQS